MRRPKKPFIFRPNVYHVADVMNFWGQVDAEKHVDYETRYAIRNWCYDSIQEFMTGKRKKAISYKVFNKWCDQINEQKKEAKKISKRKMDF